MEVFGIERNVFFFFQLTSKTAMQFELFGQRNRQLSQPTIYLDHCGLTFEKASVMEQITRVLTWLLSLFVVDFELDGVERGLTCSILQTGDYSLH